MTNNMSRSTRHSWRSLHITSLQYAGKVRNFDVLSCLGYCSVSSLGYLIDDLQKKKSLNVVVSCGPSLIALQFFFFFEVPRNQLLSVAAACKVLIEFSLLRLENPDEACAVSQVRSAGQDFVAEIYH